MLLFDSHCHFDFDAFDGDRPGLWQSCKAMGLDRLLIPGTHPEQWPRAQAFCSQYTGMMFAAGLHPYRFKQYQAVLDTSTIEECLKQDQCVAIGETGLDKRLDMPIEQQEKLLLPHLELAQARNQPLILHCVHAHNELIRCLKSFPALRGVIHGFSGSYEIAKAYIDRGFALGIGGTITYPRANKTRMAVKRLPIESLLLETDAPDMPLRGRQGQRNSPEYLLEVARALAELHDSAVEDVAAQTYANAQALFDLDGH